LLGDKEWFSQAQPQEKARSAPRNSLKHPASKSSVHGGVGEVGGWVGGWVDWWEAQASTHAEPQAYPIIAVGG